MQIFNENPLFQATNITLQKETVKKMKGLFLLPVELDPTS